MGGAALVVFFFVFTAGLLVDDQNVSFFVVVIIVGKIGKNWFSKYTDTDFIHILLYLVFILCRICVSMYFVVEIEFFLQTKKCQFRLLGYSLLRLVQNFVLRLLKKDETCTQKLHYYSCILCCFRKVAKYTEEKNKNREKNFSAAAKILCLGG